MERTSRYPWYEVVEGTELEQGDILWRCPAVRPQVEIASTTEQQVATIIYYADAIIMTQSCDLANEKIEDVLLCAHWDLEEISQRIPSFANKGFRKMVLDGRVYRYAFLAASDEPEQPMGVRIVDFSYVFTLPKAALRQLAQIQGKRLRLCPPYREHLSQAFARFFMRVGLPQQIELPE